MKRWKLIVAGAIAMGLAVGATFSAYASVGTGKDGEKIVADIDGNNKYQGPYKITSKDGSVFWTFNSDDKPVGFFIQYGGESGSILIQTVQSGKANGLTAYIPKKGSGKITEGYLYKDDVKQKGLLLVQRIKDENNVTYLVKNQADVNDGKAIALYSNGCYVGDVKDKKRDGWGTYFFENEKAWFMGEWESNSREGVGYMSYPDEPDLFYLSAIWSKDKRQNVAFYYYENDEVLLVPNKDNIKNGPAVKIEKDGTLNFLIYKDGKISDNNPDIYKDTDGSMYIGTNGKTGYGLKVYKGQIQIGNFKNGKLNGQGFTYTAKDMLRQEGTYENGILVEGTTIYRNGTFYRGTYTKDALNRYNKGLFRSFSYSDEGTFNGPIMTTGVHTVFMNDGSEATTILIDGKVKK